MFAGEARGKLRRVMFPSRRFGSLPELTTVGAMPKPGPVSSLHLLAIRMAIPRHLDALVRAPASAVVALWHRSRAPSTATLAHMRRVRSRRPADRDAPDAQALLRWDDDGGANKGGANAAI